MVRFIQIIACGSVTTAATKGYFQFKGWLGWVRFTGHVTN